MSRRSRSRSSSSSSTSYNTNYTTTNTYNQLEVCDESLGIAGDGNSTIINITDGGAFELVDDISTEAFESMTELGLAFYETSESIVEAAIDGVQETSEKNLSTMVESLAAINAGERVKTELDRVVMAGGVVLAIGASAALVRAFRQ